MYGTGARSLVTGSCSACTARGNVAVVSVQEWEALGGDVGRQQEALLRTLLLRGNGDAGQGMGPARLQPPPAPQLSSLSTTRVPAFRGEAAASRARSQGPRLRLCPRLRPGGPVHRSRCGSGCSRWRLRPGAGGGRGEAT